MGKTSSEKNEKQCRRISDVIPAEITDVPIIGMTGDREITVDGFRSVEDYSENEVSFKAGAFLITVSGRELVIRFLSLHTIVVGGEIVSVQFEKRGGGL